MKKILFIFPLFLSLIFAACNPFDFGMLNLTTIIKSRDSFILGKNRHASFSISLTNLSSHAISVYEKKLNGVAEAPVVVDSNNKIKLNVFECTVVMIENAWDSEATVALKVLGDTDLSMRYKN